MTEIIKPTLGEIVEIARTRKKFKEIISEKAIGVVSQHVQDPLERITLSAKGLVNNDGIGYNIEDSITYINPRTFTRLEITGETTVEEVAKFAKGTEIAIGNPRYKECEGNILLFLGYFVEINSHKLKLAREKIISPDFSLKNSMKHKLKPETKIYVLDYADGRINASNH